MFSKTGFYPPKVEEKPERLFWLHWDKFLQQTSVFAQPLFLEIFTVQSEFKCQQAGSVGSSIFKNAVSQIRTISKAVPLFNLGGAITAASNYFNSFLWQTLQRPWNLRRKKILKKEREKGRSQNKLWHTEKVGWGYKQLNEKLKLVC